MQLSIESRARALAQAVRIVALTFDPDQPRDESGQWTSGGASPKTEKSLSSAQADLATQKSTNERRIIIDAKTGERLFDEVGEIDRVDSSFLPPPDVEVIDLHSHPDPTSFSDADWRSFSWSHVAEMRVVGPENTFVLSKTPKWKDIKASERTPLKLEKRWNELLDKHTAGTDWDVYRVTDTVNRELAKEFGVEFKILPKAKILAAKESHIHSIADSHESSLHFRSPSASSRLRRMSSGKRSRRQKTMRGR